jgi:hypothetical protein
VMSLSPPAASTLARGGDTLPLAALAHEPQPDCLSH